MIRRLVYAGAFLLFYPCSVLLGQSPWQAMEAKPSTLGVDRGYTEFDAGTFKLKLVSASQTVAALEATELPGFDFTPNDRLIQRSRDGLYHLGDLNLRLRQTGGTEWKRYSTAAKRADVEKLNASGKVLAAANLAATLPADIPLEVIRYWETSGGNLVLRFELKNRSEETVEIGALGIPMIFNNILEGKTLDQTHAANVFYDPYIGKDAGYLQVCRLKGNGPVLLVIPSSNASFEAYNPLLDDFTPRGIAFEGFHEWMIHGKAYAENEWKNANPWIEPTSSFLKPGETRSYALKFVIAGSVKNIESKLIEENRPVAAGIPGYVIPQDVNAQLFLNYKSGIAKMEIAPKGALSLSAAGRVKNGWKVFNVNGKTWGRARLTITYKDGLSQVINYKIIHPEEKLVRGFGKFLMNKQWFTDEKDPFKRSRSVISYDYETKKQVTQENRAWIAGLSDEGGAGSWLAAIMKQLIQPDKEEIAKLQLFVNHTLWGGLQHSEGALKYGVKKSMFYYEPDKMPAGTYDKDINYKVWSAWPLKEAESTGRSYNYPHVASAHWVLYRLGRNYKGLVTEQNWQWYLSKAYHTSMAMVKQAPHYAQFGQMEGTIFLLILKDLKAEGFSERAADLETAMKKRADLWKSLAYPFGSEMPWDSTGQEEVYLWSDYFGYADKAKVTMDAILAYMPTVPHWGYNGSARRYWDFLYGGKLRRVERQLHHYGSGLNAIPVLHEFRKNPDDLYLLRVGYGGLLGSVSNITEDGFGPAAFHSFPSTLQIDGLSGDYGSNFFGYAVNTSTYILNDKDFGWVSFGGNLAKSKESINVKITTAAKSRVYIAPAGLWLTLDAGQFNSVSYNPKSGLVGVTLEPGNQHTPHAYLRIEEPGKRNGQISYKPDTNLVSERGCYVIPLNTSTKQIWLKPVK